MHITVMVFERSLLVVVDGGQIHRVDDWVMALDFIRAEDTVVVQNYRVAGRCSVIRGPQAKPLPLPFYWAYDAKTDTWRIARIYF